MIHALWRATGALLLILMLAAPAALPVAAQTSSGGSPPAGAVTLDELKRLVKTLETDAERKQFVDTLKQLIKAREATARPKPNGGGLAARINKGLERLGEQFAYAARILRQVPSAWNWLALQWETPELRSFWWEIIWKVLLALAAGILAEIAARLMLRPWRAQVEAKGSAAFIPRAGWLGVRTALDVLPIGAFALVAWLVLDQLAPGPAVGHVADYFIIASLIARAVVSAARMLLAPKATNLRLFEMEDGAARATFKAVGRLANVIVYPWFFLSALRTLPPTEAGAINLAEAGYNALLKLLGLIVLAMLIRNLIRARRPVADWLRGRADDGDDTSLSIAESIAGRLAQLWHIAVIALLVACYVTWVLGIRGGFDYLFRALLLTAIIVVVTRLVIAGLGRLISMLVAPEDDDRHSALATRAKRFSGPAQRVMQTLVCFIAFLAILQAWQVDVAGWLGTQLGQQVLGSAVSILLIIVVAVVVWEIVSEITSRYLDRLTSNQRPGQRQARMRTLLPLLQKTALVAIVVITTFVVLSELGVNIAPVLAGAGVLGLAIGFGAQTLVKDVITGVFNIIEDTMAVGDVVTVAGHSGAVEDISIRSVVLRDYSGTVHSIPFSSITSVENMTQRFAYAVIDVGIGYREDADEVMEVVKEIGAGLRKDPAFRPSLMSDLEMAGVHELGNSAVVIRCRFKVRAGMQWGIKREMNRRIKKEFDARGIEIPFPHQTIYFGEDKDGSAPSANILVKEAPKRASARREPAANKGGTTEGAETAKPPAKSKRAEKREKMDPAIDSGDG